MPPPHSDNHAFASVNLLFALPYKKPALQSAGAQVFREILPPAGTCVYSINLLRFASVRSWPVPWRWGGLLPRKGPRRGSFTLTVSNTYSQHYPPAMRGCRQGQGLAQPATVPFLTLNLYLNKTSFFPLIELHCFLAFWLRLSV